MCDYRRWLHCRGIDISTLILLVWLPKKTELENCRMQKISYRVFFLSFQIQSNRYVPIGNQNATNRYIPSIQKVRSFLLEVTWTLFEKYANFPQHHPKSFHPHMASVRRRLKKKIPRVWQLSLWPLQVVVFGPRLGFVGVLGGKLDGIHLCCWIETNKKTCGHFLQRKGRGGFPLPGCNRDWLIFHFPLLSWERICIKTVLDYFCDRATQQVTYFCGTSNSLRIFVAKNHRSEHVGMAIVLFRMKIILICFFMCRICEGQAPQGCKRANNQMSQQKVVDFQPV